MVQIIRGQQGETSMSTVTHPTPHVNLGSPAEVATLAELEAQLRRAMYEPGTPDQVSEATARTDAYQVSHMHCPGCGLKRLEYFPWHRGSAYRVLAGCSECGAAEEV
jgi:hypothetical protein